MTLSDPIADLLTRICNAKMAKHRYVDIRISKFKKAILVVLKDTGFISNYLIDDEKGIVRVLLKYNKNKESVINGLSRVSRPGVRRYVGSAEIPYIRDGLGISVISTPQGVMSGDEARRQKVGGEWICNVW